MKITVTKKEKAFEIARTMLDGADFYQDMDRTERAGHPIYATEKSYEWVSDLGDRLEVNQNADSMNIWIDPYDKIKEYQLDDALNAIDDCIYKIDDTVHPMIEDHTGIRMARDLLYGAFKEIKEILDAKYPESELYKKYNLNEV